MNTLLAERPATNSRMPDFEPSAECPFGDEPIEVPITSELDLHNFRPRDLGDLLPEYLRQCQEKGIYEVRIIHGKGTGALRAGVIKLLDRLPMVTSHRPADSRSGSWGATMAVLVKPDP